MNQTETRVLLDVPQNVSPLPHVDGLICSDGTGGWSFTVEERYIYHWTCLPKLAAGWLERVLHSDSKPAQVPPAWINEPLCWLSRLEQQTVSRLPMPFGSSLLAIGKHPRLSRPTT